MGANATISWSQVTGTGNIPLRADLVWDNIGEKPTDLLTQSELTSALTDYVTGGEMSSALANTLNTGNFDTIITKDYIASMNLVVGDEILMGANATISWNKVTNQPTIPDDTYITTIANNAITTANISANQITTGSISADRISGGTLSGITLDVTTDAKIGNVLQVGGNYGIKLCNSNSDGYLVARGSDVLRFVYGGDIFIGASLYIGSDESIGCSNGIHASSGTDYITFVSYPRKYRDWETDRKSTRLNSSHSAKSRMPSSA